MNERSELAERIENAIAWRTYCGKQCQTRALLIECSEALLRDSSPALPSEEEIARVLYDLEPYEESGEYIDGYQVSPGGALTWQQACARDAEFSDEPLMLPITKSAREAARAVLALLGKTGGEK